MGCQLVQKLEMHHPPCYYPGLGGIRPRYLEKRSFRERSDVKKVHKHRVDGRRLPHDKWYGGCIIRSWARSGHVRCRSLENRRGAVRRVCDNQLQSRRLTHMHSLSNWCNPICNPWVNWWNDHQEGPVDQQFLCRISVSSVIMSMFSSLVWVATNESLSGSLSASSSSEL